MTCPQKESALIWGYKSSNEPERIVLLHRNIKQYRTDFESKWNLLSTCKAEMEIVALTYSTSVLEKTLSWIKGLSNILTEIKAANIHQPQQQPQINVYSHLSNETLIKFVKQWEWLDVFVDTLKSGSLRSWDSRLALFRRLQEFSTLTGSPLLLQVTGSGFLYTLKDPQYYQCLSDMHFCGQCNSMTFNFVFCVGLK
jgi:hypothetical protein